MVDTSGSIGDAILTRFGAALTGILHDYKPERLVVAYCDTSVQRVEEFTPDDAEVVLRPYGGGGTLFQPGLDHFNQMAADGDVPELVIYLTDLYGENTYGHGPQQPDEYDVIWVTTECSTIPAPFGERLTMRQV